jgi:hypothetical protein
MRIAAQKRRGADDRLDDIQGSFLACNGHNYTIVARPLRA